MSYCLYLRKSRADAEAEARGEGETLARHEKMLMELARRLHLTITDVYREVVSGETIAARPEMQRLLQDVGNGMWEGVLVVEVERLARGDTIDQGIMAQTFKYSGTKIITPMKTFDPMNEFDEEYFEFGLFMSRREYKTINRRLQAGRISSVKEGKYVGNHPPYGYKRVRLEHDKGWTLEPIPEEAKIVQLIFNLYTSGELQEDGTYRRLGVGLICKKLNNMHLTSQKGGVWTIASVRDMLINPVYIGKIRWNWRQSKKSITNGKITRSRGRSHPGEYILMDGLHPALISEETFNLAQEIIATNPPRPLNERATVKNPLSGLIICGKCGRRMVRRPAGKRQAPDVLMCGEPTCHNVSVALHFVEERLIRGLEDWLTGYKLQWDNAASIEDDGTISVQMDAYRKLENELKTNEKQLLKTHDLLEQEVYSVDMFLDRSRVLNEKIEVIKRDMSVMEKSIATAKARIQSRQTIIPTVEKLLEVYWSLPSAQAKNDMLKEVLEKAVYTKERSGRYKNVQQDDFELVLYPKLPYSQTLSQRKNH